MKNLRLLKNSNFKNICCNAKVLILVAAAFSIISFDAVAQKNMGKKSPTKQISFIFYKLAGLEPDFDFWTEEYTKNEVAKYGEVGKRYYVKETRDKLISDFRNTIPENETIIIHLDAYLEPLSLDNDGKKYLNIYFKESPPFISKRTPKYNINIVVPKLENKVQLVLNEKEYEQMDKLFYASIRAKNFVSVKLFLKPISADVENPIERDGKKFALLLTELKDFEIWSDIKREQYWPLPPTEEELRMIEDQKTKADFMSKYK